MRTSKTMVGAVVFGLTLLSGVGRAGGQPNELGDLFTARHTSPGPARMSGLIMLGLHGEHQVISALGNPADDLYFTERWGYPQTDVGIILTFIVAEMSPDDPALERATIVTPAIASYAPYLVPMLDVPGASSPLMLRIDGRVPFIGMMTPPAGTALDAVGGEVFRDGGPITGWYVGRRLDSVTGTVSDPYTGPLVVRTVTFEATTFIPAPGAWGLAIAVAAHRRRR